ncbi:MAG: DEAD/DEAH box helicase, partial [Desulfobacterales bacterium]
SALILTPTPLVSQWQEELKAKFGLDIPSTDDRDYRTKGASFWEEPFVLASINLAKSKNNFPVVTEREYDMVIVDEAHHLKNRNTLNWKLVNALKKRFLLLLTATPVENNLMELYNLVTLLKPGQLKTASAFRKEFMTRGDPTDPQNRGKLKELLGQVMIRNTRAVAKIDIPLRFAQTIKVDCDKNEKELYERISALVKNINKTNGTGHKLLLKNLLAEAGSSPRSVGITLSRILAKKGLLLEQEKEIRAINNLCRSLDDTRKNRLLLKLIKSSPGKKIIFVKYLGTLDHISDFLSWQGVPHALFHGSMDNRKKDEQIRSFREDKEILVTTEIGGEGCNLQFCHQMVNYDLPWNPMKIEQRIGRIHRIGQEKEVMIYNLCATGSVEDYILEVLDKKINMFEMVIGEIDMIMGRIKGEQEFSEMVYDIWVNSPSEEAKGKSFDQLASRLKRAQTLYQKTKALDEKLFGENYEL